MTDPMTGIAAIFADPANWAALAALVTMEVVLGIDNLIFISILTNKLPVEYRGRARLIGIGLALGLRLVLLSLVAFIVTLTRPAFEPFGHPLSWRDIILIGGGLFLVWKATTEIHHNVEQREGGTAGDAKAAALGFGAAIFQIILLDLVFSLDSVITAVGMVDNIPVMIAAVVIAVVVMMLFSGTISGFVERHPTIKMLALSFLLLIGVNLIAEGAGFHIPKGYTYFAMGFALSVELLNLKLRSHRLGKIAD